MTTEQKSLQILWQVTDKSGLTDTTQNLAGVLLADDDIWQEFVRASIRPLTEDGLPHPPNSRQ